MNTKVPAKSGATAVPGVSPTQLRYSLIAQYGRKGVFPPIFYCDRDASNPEAKNNEITAAEKWLSSNNASGEYQDIVAHLSLSQATLTPEQKLQVYRQHKLLTGVNLYPAAEGYRFTVRVALRGSGAVQIGPQTDGLITRQGVISDVKQREIALMCAF